MKTKINGQKLIKIYPGGITEKTYLNTMKKIILIQIENYFSKQLLGLLKNVNVMKDKKSLQVLFYNKVN